MRKTCLIVIAALASSPLTAESPQPYLVRDVNGEGSALSSSPWRAVIVGSIALFTACDASHGRELWRTDGTPGATELVLDIRAGSLGSGADFLAASSAGAFFQANDGIHGTELWWSDGTSEGTHLVKDTVPGPETGAPRGECLTDSGLLVFAAYDPTTYKNYLWRSDGTSAGTTPVFGAPASGPTDPHPFACLGTKVFFAATDPEHGREPWISDGTMAGTKMLADINAAGSSIGSSDLAPVAVGNSIYFLADDGIHGKELWKTSGAVGDAQMVEDIRTGPASTFFVGMVASQGTLFLSLDDGVHGVELWSSKGTAGNTDIVFDQASGTGELRPEILIPFSGGVAFHALRDDDPIWFSSGVSAGTHPIAIGPVHQDSVAALPLGTAGGRLYFAADYGSFGYELWSLEQPSTAATLVDDLNAGYASASVYGLGSLGDAFFFAANDGLHGTEPWITEGDSLSTKLLMDVAGGTASAGPHDLTPTRDGLFVLLDDGVHGKEIWRSDGTDPGTELLVELVEGQNSGLEFSWLTGSGADLYFQLEDPTVGGEVWASDGTAGGTHLVSDVVPGWNPTTAVELTPAGPGELFFGQVDAQDEWTLFHVAGPSEPALALGPGGHQLTWSGDRLYYVAWDEQVGEALWTSDGTADGTTLLVDINAEGYSSNINEVTAFGGKAFFSATDGVNGSRLWMSDGTVPGTAALSLTTAGLPTDLTAVGDVLYFVALDQQNRRGLWKTNGTPAGTKLVRLLSDTPAIDQIQDLHEGGGHLFFLNCPPFPARCSLWRSDGTANTTVPLLEMGLDLPRPLRHASLGGSDFFVNWDPGQGSEIWRSDGTPDGSAPVGEVVAGSGDGDPHDLVTWGGKLFFTADDGVHGRELWAVQVGVFEDGFELGDTCNWTFNSGAVACP